jgi:hypothetical protein
MKREPRKYEFLENVKYFLRYARVRTLILFIFAGGLVLFLYFYVYKEEGGLTRWADATFVAAMVCFAWGCFKIIGDQGTFDALRYGASNLYYIFVYHDEKKYENLAAYKKSKEEQRHQDKWVFLYYFAVSLIFFAIFAGIYIALKIQYPSL